MLVNLLALLLCLTFTVQADDTELFVKVLPGESKPNVLLLIDTSSSMKAIVGNRRTVCETKKILGFIPVGQTCHYVGTTRMDIVENAVIRFLHEAEDVNISLMRFNDRSWIEKTCLAPLPLLGCLKYKTTRKWRSDGGLVAMAFEDIATARSTAVATFILDFFPAAYTPLSEALFEAGRYFNGDTPYWGSNGTSSAMRNGHYISPITHSCQKNSIVIFSDGKPSDDTDSNGRIGDMIKGLRVPPGLDSNCSGQGGCLEELAWYLANEDQSDWYGKQTINTYTIGGFGVDPEFLVNTARHGGGRYYEASEVERLVEVLKDSLARVRAEPAFFAAPATSVSATNSLEHAEDVYYTMFKPGRGAGWTGNLKRYRFDRNNELVGVNGKPALDSRSGFFSDITQSYWSSEVDGNRVESGGMVEHLSQNRPVLTNMLGDSNIPLRQVSNLVREHNANIYRNPSLLGVRDESEARSTLAWARGVDVEDEDRDGNNRDDRKSIGDPLHTQPQVVTYFKNGDGSKVDKSVFFTTNDGFLHSVNADNGVTQFSFIPKDLLGNLTHYRHAYDARGDGPKIYGMDGPMTVWHHDVNGDGDVLKSSQGRRDSGEHVYLYLTMRRGGSNIYALDVTDPGYPTLKWIIRGSKQNNLSVSWTNGFGNLAQTWSAPKLVQVKWNGRLRHVLLFGGGYDEQLDNENNFHSSYAIYGDNVYMVDAESGQLLWSASRYYNADLYLHDLKYAIPAALTPVDLDGDSAVDVIFGTDVGGQIFRIDINQNNSGASNFATGGVIAKLSGNSLADARRFFEPVAVAFGKENRYLNISVGSGFRPSPLSTTVNDRMYVIKDPHVTSKPSNYGYVNGRPITEADLYDATSNLVQEGNSSQRSTALSRLNSARGWYMKLEISGEKVLGKAVIHNGVLLFTTFVPMLNGRGDCLPAPGANYIYAVNIDNGGAVSNLNQWQWGNMGSGLNKSDRRKGVNNAAIAPSPTIISRIDGGASVCVGNNCLHDVFDPVTKVPVHRRYWRENR